MTDQHKLDDTRMFKGDDLDDSVTRDFDAQNTWQSTRALDDDEIRSLTEQEIAQADTFFAGDLSEERENAMEYYLGMSRGDEIEGRSNVISTDVADVIEWILPQCIKALGTVSDVVEFEPLDSDSMEQASLESKIVSHAIKSQPDSYEVLYTAIKDALLQKNGVIKSRWVKDTQMRLENYEDLNEMELFTLMQGDGQSEVEVLEQESTSVQVVDELTGVSMSQQAFSVKLRRTWVEERVESEVVAPEQFLISREAMSIDVSKARFSCHKVFMMASDLVEEGFDPDFVDSLPVYTYDNDSGERETRRFLEDETDYFFDSQHGPTKRVLVYECYIRLDRDGDGIAELLKVRLIGGDGSVLLDIEEVDANPFAAGTPFILGHKFYGLSLFDKLKEIQDQKTVIWRQLLDNLYLTNNQRHVVVEGEVNLDDMLDSRAGGLIRATNINAVAPLAHMPAGPEAYTMLETMNNIRRERAGVSVDSGSQAFAVGNETAHGIERMMTAGEELQGLIIRTLAETLIKGHATNVRELIAKNAKPMNIQIDGEWIDTDPRDWDYKTSVTVKPILGMGDKAQKTNAILGVIAQQDKFKSMGEGVLVSMDNRWKAVEELVQLSDLTSAGDYFTNPNSPEGQQAAQAEAQSNQAAQEQAQEMQDIQAKALQADAQANMQIAELNNQIKLLTKQVDAQSKSDDLVFKYDQLKADTDLKYATLELQNNVDIKGQGIDEVSELELNDE